MGVVEGLLQPTAEHRCSGSSVDKYNINLKENHNITEDEDGDATAFNHSSQGIEV